MYDTGPGSNFGTGEIETMTSSTSNVRLDGNGHLDITALGSGSSWTSGRVQTTSANVGAPAGGELEVTALGKCLDVNGGGTVNGTVVDLFTCNGTGAQAWVPQPDGALVNPQSGRCLDDTSSGGSGTQVQIWDCAGTPNQAWNLP
jgi:hypothetical protein